MCIYLLILVSLSPNTSRKPEFQISDDTERGWANWVRGTMGTVGSKDMSQSWLGSKKLLVCGNRSLVLSDNLIFHLQNTFDV